MSKLVDEFEAWWAKQDIDHENLAIKFAAWNGWRAGDSPARAAKHPVNDVWKMNYVAALRRITELETKLAVSREQRSREYVTQKDTRRYTWFKEHAENWQHYLGDWKLTGLDAAIDDAIEKKK